MQNRESEENILFHAGGYILGLKEMSGDQFTMIFDNGKDMRMWDLDMKPDQKELVLQILESAVNEATFDRWRFALSAMREHDIGGIESGW